MEGSSNV